MRDRWDGEAAAALAGDPLGLRVYSSRLLGQEPYLVLHGGGNTSVKLRGEDFFGDPVDLLYVKASGSDLASIRREDFAALRMDALGRLAELGQLTDRDMQRVQRAAMLDPTGPAPSVEAILHAIIPGRFVDHTHADLVVALSNLDHGPARVREVLGPRVRVVPYVMPGFALARRVRELTRDTDWSGLDGIVLVGHGVFTLGADARESYDRMIRLVSAVEGWFDAHAGPIPESQPEAEDLGRLSALRGAISRARGAAVVARWDRSRRAVGFSRRADLESLATRGPLTPDHVIRAKRVPLLVDSRSPPDQASAYAQAYRAYVAAHRRGGERELDPAPRWAIWPGHGCLAFDTTPGAAEVILDLAAHTLETIQRAEAAGGWRALSPQDIFDVEYWELEQAKLGQARAVPELAGKIALVTGAASGIGNATVEALLARGAVVAGLDIAPAVTELRGPTAVGLLADVTDSAQVDEAVRQVVRRFGGLDVVISNAGAFPAGAELEATTDAAWEKSLELNLTSHLRVIRAAVPFLAQGVDPAVVVIGSRNVVAPGPGVAAYSVPKAGLTQLARVAALELGPRGIRVNLLHPDKVFDTAIWTPERLAERAARYGLSVEAYRKRNLLGVEVRSRDVAELACALAGPLFARTTGAQIPVDGGDERVI
jgi:rhamnose utilization protein RhaD (predicted bifunctional aldolase and dehydrogenase)/NAD(P)-dependent dehydrogenase (short-subunit alcohol dehydrogenase family)